MDKEKYHGPYLSKGDGNWYVRWGQLNPATEKIVWFKIHKGLNTKAIRKNKRDREDLIKQISNSIKLLMSNDFSWLATKEQLLLSAAPAGSLKAMTLSEALTWALQKRIIDKKKKPLEARTISDRESAIHLISEMAGILNLNKRIGDIERVDLIAILDGLHQTRNFGNRRYNSLLETIQSLYKVLFMNDVIRYNPALQIERLSVKRSKVHHPPLDQERKIIVTFLREQCYPLYVIAKLEFLTGIRTDEIRYLKPSSIDVAGNGIYLREDEVKDDEERYMAIPDDLLYDFLGIMAKCGPDDYLFSTGTKQHRVNHSLLFQPGTKQMSRNMIARYFKKLVKDKDGLGINRTLYSFKKAGANKMRGENITVREIGKQFGHSSEKVTEIYLTDEDLLRNEKIRGANLEFE